MFDPDSFLSTPVEGSLDTTFTPVPEGEYTASVSKFNFRTPKDSVILEVFWEVDDETVRQETGMDNPTVRQSIFLDVTPDGGLDMGKGKNVQLGRLREAVGQNGPEPWTPGMLEGAVARVKVTHTINNGNVYANVSSVAPAQ